MAIDWTINITGLLGIITAAIGMIFFVATVQNDLKDLQRFQEATVETLQKLTAAVAAIALADARISALDRRVDDEKADVAEFRHWVRDEFTKKDSELGQLWAAVYRKSETFNRG